MKQRVLLKKDCFVTNKQILIVFWCLLCVNVWANDSAFSKTGVRTLSEVFNEEDEGINSVQKQTVTGTVTDENGVPLPGVSVLEKGTLNGSNTDFDGKYTLEVRASESVLVFSYIGYATQEIVVGNLSVVDAKLTPDVSQLDEVVVIGYGSQKRLDVTGAVASVKSDVSESRAVLSMEDALTGKVSGVRVQTPDGAPGSVAQINIRGATSLIGGSNPLYIIDGFPSETNTVSPGNIESIDILKDAASTAIYGSRGANGVIIITTKKGKKNDLNVELYALSGIQEASNKLDLLNSYDFAKKNDLFGFFFVPARKFDPGRYDIEAYSFFQDDEDNYYLVSNENNYRNPKYYEPGAIDTDWQDEMFRTAVFSDYRINVAGGGDSSTYSVMLGHKNQEGILRNTNYEEYNVRTNLGFDITDRIKLTMNNAINRNNTSGYADAVDGLFGVFYHTLVQAPVKPVDFDENFILPGEDSSGSQLNNPVHMANVVENDKRHFDALTNMGLHIALPKGFGLNITGGYYYANIREDRYFPSNVAAGLGVNGRSIRGNHVSERVNNENVLTYDTVINDDHKLQLLGGASFSKGTFSWVTSVNTDFTREGLGYYGHGLGLEPQIPTSTLIENTLASFYARVNYNFSDLWLLKFTMRTDGSSRFAENNKWGYFPSAAVGYRLSEASFFENVDFVNNLKFRASWGITGKQAIPSYQSLAAIGIGNFSIDGETSTLVSFPARLDSPDLKWETTEEFNFGLDLSLFDERLNLTADLYNRRTRDLLYREPVPSYSGYSVGLRNVGIVDNKGFELGINGQVINYNDFTWDANLNISTNTTEIVEFGQQPINFIGSGAPGQIHGILEEGEPLGNWYGYQTNGIWQSDAEIVQARTDGLIANSQKVLPGYRKYVDQDGNGVINADDRVIIGNSQPDFFGGFTNTLKYKGLQLSFLLSYSFGGEVYDYTAYALSEGNDFNNQIDLDRWTPTLYNWDPLTSTKGDLYLEGSKNNEYPIAMFGKPQDNTFIDAYVEDASYVRLSDITLSYNIPKVLIESVGLSDANLFISGRNLAIWTKYKGFDPEVNNSQGEASFLLPGLDLFAYPKSKILSIGCKLTF